MPQTEIWLHICCNTTLAELSYGLIEKCIYIRFPWYKGTCFYVQICATKNTPLGEIINRVIFRDDVHTHFVTLIVKWTNVGGWVKPLDDKRGKVGTIKSPKNLY